MLLPATISAWTFTKSPQEAVMYRSSFALVLSMAALAAILLPSSLNAEINFERTYGGTNDDDGWSAQQTAEGGYVVAGNTSSYGAGNSDIYLIKTDAAGDMLWTRTFGGPAFDYCRSVQQTADGGYILAGYTSSFGAGFSDIYLVKTDSSGETLWTRTYGGAEDDYGYAVRQTAEGGFIVTGETHSFGSGGNVYLVRTNANGNALWTRTYGGESGEFGCSVQPTTDSGFIIVGSTSSFGAGGSDVYLVKTDANGDTLWSRTFGGTNDDYGGSVQQTIDGGYAIAGYTWSFGAGDGDVYLIKTDVTGDTMWTRTFGGAGYDGANSVQQTTDGGYAIAGHTTSFGAGGYDVYLLKTDERGDTQWTKTYGGSDNEVGYSIQPTADGGYVIAGGTHSFGSGGCDVYLIKTDSLGNVAVAEPKASPTRAPALSLTCEPNPCRGATTISLKPQASSSKRPTLRIYDAQGRLVLFQTVRASSFIFHPSSLPSGAYFVRVDAGNEHATARVVLQR